MPTPEGSEQPAKRQSKWSAQENATIIELRGSGMKWEDISKQIPGRSAISCRLHYQNYLERRPDWTEERKDKLAQLYERFKAEMWSKVAEELAVPWRAAEAMHWSMGEVDMAARAGTTPFSMAAVNADARRRRSPSRTDYNSYRHDTVPLEIATAYDYGSQPATGRPQAIGTRREAMPPPPLSARTEQVEGSFEPPLPALAPVQLRQTPQSASGTFLPSIAEMTTGVAPYHGPHDNTPAQGVPMTPGPYHPHMPTGPDTRYSVERQGVKRPASPENSYHDTNQRRRIKLEQVSN
ncbi:uncharacterized protein F5Z01DRAFT_671053 [Emericellopsis atlantica]|uniref:Uncharacterized protein n=1 Tax=Emericellopsis atlantica TaxID=2614577 RepID=A0A9P7ZSJ5_9HYPO|nr:uncharacterized protein F5Z01DRAFT_671053 [Emericellopsis atlantica]KAG9257455.1 hypothetical protein F5Z01DRAFT_671053 [Emericellopsis atlantica]